MNSSSCNKLGATWSWRRAILPGQEEMWIARLEAAGAVSWAFTERPGRTRILLEAYVKSRAAGNAIAAQWGGRVRAVHSRQRLKSRPSPPTRIGRSLEIVHDKTQSRKKADAPRLLVPHGLAFGSGEHATTFMLLRELARREDGSPSVVHGTKVLDLGTGSGVLALAARLFGARKIVATDFDPDAVRTARQNEELNFSRPLIHWRRADVKRLRAATRYDFVLANLFSGILEEAAAQIAGCVAPGGQVWLSGVLESQGRGVVAAYRKQGLRLIRVVRRGKWVMVLLKRSKAS